jgi:regulator of sirC expression with transglutaminase-like and TPR domain
MSDMLDLRTNAAWERLAALPDDDIPLLEACLLIARDEYPELDVASYEARLQQHVEALYPRVRAQSDTRGQLAELNRYLFLELGFTGNQQDYYDPRNSYLNDVFDRRLGIPISLGIIQIELARRLGLGLEGVSFPGHFLVRLPMEGGLLVLDPYHQGRSIDAEELKARARPHLGGGDIDDQQLLDILAPAGHRTIIVRMLRNLKSLYSEREAWDKALRCADRLVRLDPTQPEESRDRGLFYLKLGHGAAARVDLARYLAQKPQAGDTETVRLALIEAGATSGRLN